MVQIYFAFRNAALFSDELMLIQPKTDIPGLLKKKKNLQGTHFVGNIKTCAYEISLELHFYDL